MKRDSSEHEQFMRRALKLAEKASGLANPNPLVGAVVVKQGRIVGQGYHRQAGLDHAEVVALKQAGADCRGARLYITLEPCVHFGRTPPCVAAIKASGIREVVVATKDPNPINHGKGIRLLRRNKIKVIYGILKEEAKEINCVFAKYVTQGLPYVTVKVAQSIDGKIATSSGDAHWITSESSRRIVHRLRAQADAILVGINTVLRDNPLLSCRLNGRLYRKQPKKIIVDSRLRLIPGLQIFSRRSPAEVIIATTQFAAQRKIAYLRGKGHQVIIARDECKRVNLGDLLCRLARQGIAHILIEGGGEVIARALELKLVDKMLVFVAPKIIGGRDAPTAVDGRGINRIKAAIELAELKLRRVDSDIMIEGRPRYVHRNY